MSYAIFKASLTPPQPRTVTMLTNVAEKYGTTLTKVKNMYFRGIYDVLTEKGVKKTKSGYVAGLEALQPEDFRAIWYKLHNKLQTSVEVEGGKKAKSLKVIQDETKEIIKADIVRLTRRINKMEKDIEEGKLGRYEKGLAKEKIAMYREYLRKAKNKESLGHFTQMLRDHPDLTSFLFKPKR